MKKVFLLLVLFSMVACEQDDDTSGLAINEANIAGKWYFESSRLNADDYELYSHNCTTKHDYVEFLDNGMANTVNHSDCTSEPTTEAGTWSLEGTTFTFTDSEVGSEPNEFEVKSLTDYKLSLIETTTNDDGTVDVLVVNFSRN